MKQIWVKKIGWFYMPVHYLGLLITLAAIACMLPVCIATSGKGHSPGDDLSKIFVFVTCTAFWWKWIADKTSE